MGSFSNYLEGKLLDHIFGGGNDNYTAASPLYLALSTASPLENGSGVTEPSGGAYARKATYSGDWEAAATPAGTIQNAATITFTTATADWGTIVSFAAYDDPTAGNMLMYGDLSASKTVSNLDTARFGTGAFDVSLS